MTDTLKKQVRKSTLCKRTKKEGGLLKNRPIVKKDRFQPNSKGSRAGDVLEKRTAQTSSKRSVSTRRQKSTLTKFKQKTPKCGPGTIVSDNGKCVPATASNVFGMTKTTIGRTPIPADYSCEVKKPTSDLMCHIILVMVRNLQNNYEQVVRGNHNLAAGDAAMHASGLIFEIVPGADE